MPHPRSSYILHCHLGWHSGFMCQSHTLDISSLLRGKLASDGLVHQISEPRKIKVKSGW